MKERRLLTLMVVVWHALVLCCLAYLVGVIRPARGTLLQKYFAPVAGWAQSGNLLRTRGSRGLAVLSLMLLAAGIFVLVVYLLNRRVGWGLMFVWNLLGAINYCPQSFRARSFTPALVLSLAFAAAVVASFLARPRALRS